MQYATINGIFFLQMDNDKRDNDTDESGKSLSEYTTEESDCDTTLTESSWHKLKSNTTYSINKG